jgi:short-subunit dehydrogenase
MKNNVKYEKYRLARIFVRITGRMPELKRALKSLISIKYFLPPAAHLKDIMHFLIVPEKQYPAIRYPLIEERLECRKLAIITGATSGIGKAFAHCFARQGYDLLITGRRREVIAGVAGEIRREYGVKVNVVIADLSVKEDVMALLQTVGMQHNIEVLVNNAGYGMNLNFSQDEINHQLDMMSVHVNAPLMLIHKVLPQMIERRSGIILNVSSMAAYFPASGSTLYISTKSFLKSFTESLFLDVGRYGIRVQCLCPGFTTSDFHKDLNILTDRIKHGLLPWMEPSAVVKYSLNCLEKGKIVCIPGRWNRLLTLLVSVMPRSLYYRLSLRLEKKVRFQKEIAGKVFTPAVI